MGIHGKCEKCGCETIDYCCSSCLAAELEQTKLQISRMGPVVQAAVEFAECCARKRGEEAGVVVLLNKVHAFVAKPICEKCGAPVDSGYHARQKCHDAEGIGTPVERQGHQHEWVQMPLKKMMCPKCGDTRDSG